MSIDVAAPALVPSAEEALAAVDPAAVAAARAARPGWTAFARADDRAAWEAVDETTRVAVLEHAHAALAAPPPLLTASQWLAFQRTGDRRAYEDGYFRRRRDLGALALALALDPDGPWLPPLLDLAWAILEETTWCVPAHDNTAPGIAGEREPRPLPDPDHPTVDLFAAETAATLATLAALHRQRAGDDPAVAELFARVHREVDTRVLRPFEQSGRDYHWFGIPSNWNPWIVSNVLTAALLEELGEERWRGIARDGRASLAGYRAAIPDDGGCTEGVAYWWQSAGRYFEALELLTAFDPAAEKSTMADPLLGRLARYPLGVHLGGPWSANFGDGAARTPPPGRGPTREHYALGLLHRFARRVGDDELARFARARRGAGPLVELPVALSRAVAALTDPAWVEALDAPARLPVAEYLPRLQVLTARERPDGSGLTVVAKGGHNGEPHNHNDVGSFVVASDGAPVVIDAGTGTYTRDSFGPRRYEAWFTRSAFHSTPTPAGSEQAVGADARARDVRVEDRSGRTSLDLDLAEAYPPSALRGWRRRVTLDRADRAVVVADAWSADAPLRPRVQLLLAAVEGDPTGGATLVARAADGEDAPPLAIVFTFDRGDVEVEVETIPLADAQLAAVWGPTIVRLTATPARDGEKGTITTTFRQLPPDEVADVGGV